MWASPAGPVPVEAAVVAHVEAAGRRCVHAENWFWTSCFALVFRELYWLPVPGRLPTPRRPGPLDLGTPAFYGARQDAADRALGRLRVEGISPFAKSYGGEILAGLVRPDLALDLALDLPGDLLASVLSELLRRGFDAARGLPDLLVLGGRSASVPGALPSTLPQAAFLAEVKGPGDTLRDSQRVWIDKLVNEHIHVELWTVSEYKVTPNS
ncbi:MAG: VRR-NUC domain-containing protein [Deltaproteobacteria bacterium]|nr:VRR-NUC domain-containing protein [Deltaproteobacteria bacterium]